MELTSYLNPSSLPAPWSLIPPHNNYGTGCGYVVNKCEVTLAKLLPILTGSGNNMPVRSASPKCKIQCSSV